MTKKSKVKQKPFNGIKRARYRGKYYITHFKQGKPIERVKWTKATPIKSFISRAKVTGSIIKGVERQKLTNVIEVTDFRKDPKVRKGQLFQGIAKLTTEDGTFTARSLQTTNKNVAMKDAIRNVKLRAVTYDEDDLAELNEDIRKRPELLQVGVVRYEDRR